MGAGPARRDPRMPPADMAIRERGGQAHGAYDRSGPKNELSPSHSFDASGSFRNGCSTPAVSNHR